jgi:hypothetical protein
MRKVVKRPFIAASCAAPHAAVAQAGYLHAPFCAHEISFGM